MKRFDLMALYKPQSCIEGDKERYVEIKPVKNYESFRLCRTKGNVNLTDYWFSMVNASKEQPPGYNCQFISMISDKTDDGNWWEGRDKKWICLGFFKFRLEELGVSMEKMQEAITRKISREEHKWFRTLDNADSILVFFADGKSELDSIRKEIRDVTWAREKEKNENGETRETIYFTDYYLSGQCSILPADRKEDGKSELKIEKLQFSQGEEGSQFDGEKDRAESGKDKKRPRYKIKDNGWCVRTIEMLKGRIDQYQNEKNKKMIAYYQGLMQIINVIAQYEQEILLKDMFYIFYPPLALFIKQLEEGESRIRELKENAEKKKTDRTAYAEYFEQKYIQMQKMESGISEFLDTVEMLMRHMGQSCPDMINDTGRQGLPYDIPLRLCLMYVSYLNVITDILNDTEYEYQYCLAPLVYSRPTTNFIDFGLPPKSRLIRVRISRHCMFTPRSSMIILAHEVSHYVNEKARNRRARSVCYINCVSILLTCIICPGNILHKCGIPEKGGSGKLDMYLQIARAKINRYIRQSLKGRINEAYEKGQNDIYHLNRLFEAVWSICLDLLYDEKGELRKRIYRIDEELMKKLRLVESDEGLIRDIHRLQETMSDRCMSIWAGDDLYKYMQNLKNIFKETYTDLSSINLLDLKPIDYLEAILISESYNPDVDLIDTVLIERVAMVKIIMESSREPNAWKDEWKKTDVEALKKNAFLIKLKEKVDDFCIQYKESDQAEPEKENNLMEQDDPDEISEEIDLLFCREIIDEERIYFEQCREALSRHIRASSLKKGRFDRKRILCRLYEQFAVYEKNADPLSFEFFDAYADVIECYKGEVRKKWFNNVFLEQ